MNVRGVETLSSCLPCQSLVPTHPSRELGVGGYLPRRRPVVPTLAQPLKLARILQRRRIRLGYPPPEPIRREPPVRRRRARSSARVTVTVTVTVAASQGGPVCLLTRFIRST